MAFHIPEFLAKYGPAHGWWAFPFERAIGQLQRMSTNYKQYEYEETIAQSWHRAANLKGLLLKEGCPETVWKCLPMFNTLVRPPSRGTLAIFDAEESDSFDESTADKHTLVPLPIEYGKVFQRARPGHFYPPDVVLSTHVQHLGLSYTTHTRHAGNGFILLHDTAAPFFIKHIVEFPESKHSNALQGTWLIGSHAMPTVYTSDPYMAWPELGARLWSVNMYPEVKAVMLSDVEAHSAWLELDTDMVVISLRRSLP
ncbi:hypothetical protein DXG01_007033 [Tephrocybe rancida]|nr:hypothetical protein DXG01_007033 [Tephrocybe rancida]